MHNTPQPIVAKLATPHSNGIATPNISFAMFCHKPSVLGDLTDGLKKIGVAKNKWKEFHDAAMEETWHIEICVKAEVEKKRLNIERELGVCRLALEERQQKFRERIVLEAQETQKAQRYNLHIRLPGNPHSRHTSVNWTPIMDEQYLSLGVRDEFFTLSSPNIKNF